MCCILKFHKKCVETALNFNDQALKQRQTDEANPHPDDQQKVYGAVSVFLFDELGLAEIGPENPLKVLHALLEPEKHLIAFIGISNWKLDQSKMSRALFVARPEPQDEDLKDMFKLSEITKLVPNAITDAICSAYSQFQKNEAREKEDWDRIRTVKEQAEGKVSDEVARLTEKYKFLHPDFFGLRDLYNLIKFINRHVTRLYAKAQQKHPAIMSPDSEQWAALLFRFVINGIERNFSGKKSRHSENIFRSECLFKSFFASVLDKKLEAHSYKKTQFSTVTELINQNLLDDECRYLMLFTENPSINANIIKYLTSYFCQQGYELNRISDFSRVRSREEMDKIVQNLATQIEQGHVLILYQTPELNSCLFEVLNKQRVQAGPDAVPSRCELQTGGDRNELVTIHPKFRVILLMDLLNEDNMSRKQPAPFLNRFEKQLVVYEDLISETRTVQKEVLQTKLESIKRTEFGSRQLLLHGYSEEILHSLVLREQHESLLSQGSANIETYINQIVFEQQKTSVQQKAESLEEQEALIERGLLDMTRLFSRDMLFYLEVCGSKDKYLPIEQIEEKFLETHPFDSLGDMVHSFAKGQMVEQNGPNGAADRQQPKNLLVFTTTQSYETIQLCHKHRMIVVKRVQEYEKLIPDEISADISQLLQKPSYSQMVVFLFESRREWSRMPELRKIVDNVKQSETVQAVFVAHYTYQELAAPNMQVQTSITFSSRKWEQYVVEDLMGSNYRWLNQNLKKPLVEVLRGLQERFCESKPINFEKYTDLHLGLAEIIIRKIHEPLPVSYETIHNMFSREAGFIRRVIKFALDRDFPDKETEFLSLLKKDVLMEGGSIQTLDFEVSISNWSIINLISSQANEVLKPFLEELLEAVSVGNLAKCLRVGGIMAVEGFKSWLDRSDKYLRSLEPKKPKVRKLKVKPPGANPFLSDDEIESIEEPVESNPTHEHPDSDPQIVPDGNSLIRAIQAFRNMIHSSLHIKQLLSEIGQLKSTKTFKLGQLNEPSPEYDAALEEDKEKLVKLFKDLLQQLGNSRLTDYLPEYKQLSNIDKFAVSETIPAIYMQLILGEVEPCVSLLLMRLAFAYFQQMDNSNGVRDHLYGTAMVLLYEIFKADLQLVTSDIFQDEAQLKQTLDMFTRGFLLPMGANLKTLLDAPVSLHQTQGGIQASLAKIEQAVDLLEKSLQEKPQQQSGESLRAKSEPVDTAEEIATDEKQQNLIWAKGLLQLYRYLARKDGAAIEDFMGAVGSQSPGAAAQISKEAFVLQSAQSLVEDKKLLTVQGQTLFVKGLLRDILGLLLLTTVEPEHQDKILDVHSKFTKSTVDPRKAETLEPLIDLLSSLILNQIGSKHEHEAVEKLIDELLESNSVSKTSAEAKILKEKVLSRVITKIEHKLTKAKTARTEISTLQLEDFGSVCEFFNDLLVKTKSTDPIDVQNITRVSIMMHRLKTTVQTPSPTSNPQDLSELHIQNVAETSDLKDFREVKEAEHEELQAHHMAVIDAENPVDEGDWEDCSDDPELQQQSTTQSESTSPTNDTTAASGENLREIAVGAVKPEAILQEKLLQKVEWKIEEIDRILAEGIRNNNIGAVVLAREIVRYLGSSQQSLEDHSLKLLADCYREATNHQLVKLLGDRSLPEVKKVDHKIKSQAKFQTKDLPKSDWSSIVRFASHIIYSDHLSVEELYPKDDNEESTWVMRILDSAHLRKLKDNFSILAVLAAFTEAQSENKQKMLKTLFNNVRKINAGDEKSGLHNGLLINDIMEIMEKFTHNPPHEYRVDAQADHDDDEDMKQERTKKLQNIERQEADLMELAKKFSFCSPIRTAIFKIALPKILEFVQATLNIGQVRADFFRGLDDEINRLMNSKRLEEFLKIAAEDGTLPDEQERTRLKSLWTAMGMMDPMHCQSEAPAIGTYLPFSLPSLDDLRENSVESQDKPENSILLRNVLNMLEHREVYEAHPQVLWSLKELLRLVKRKFDFKFTKEEAQNEKLSSFVGAHLQGEHEDQEIFVLSAEGSHFDQEVQRAYLQFREQWKNYLKLICQHQKFSVFKTRTKSMKEVFFKEADLEKLLSTDLPIAHFLLRPEQETRDDPTKQLVAAVLTNLSSIQNNLIDSFGVQQSGRNPLFKLKREHLASKLGETGNMVELCLVPEPDKQQVMACLFGEAYKEFRTVDYQQTRVSTSADFEKYNYKDGEPVDLRNTIIDVLGDTCKLKDGPENIEAYKTAVTIAMKVNTTNTDQLTAISRFLLNSLEDFQKVDGIHPETELEAVFKQPPVKIEGYKQLKLKHLVHFVTYLGRMKYTKVLLPQQKQKPVSDLKVSEVLKFDSKNWAANDIVKRLDMEITYWYYLLSLTPVDKLNSTEKLFGSHFMANWSWYKGAAMVTNHSQNHPILVPASKLLRQNCAGNDPKLLDPERATVKGSVMAYLEGMNLIWKSLINEKDPIK